MLSGWDFSWPFRLSKFRVSLNVEKGNHRGSDRRLGLETIQSMVTGTHYESRKDYLDHGRSLAIRDRMVAIRQARMRRAFRVSGVVVSAVYTDDGRYAREMSEVSVSLSWEWRIVRGVRSSNVRWERGTGSNASGWGAGFYCWSTVGILLFRFDYTSSVSHLHPSQRHPSQHQATAESILEESKRPKLPSTENMRSFRQFLPLLRLPERSVSSYPAFASCSLKLVQMQVRRSLLNRRWEFRGREGAFLALHLLGRGVLGSWAGGGADLGLWNE